MANDENGQLPGIPGSFGGAPSHAAPSPDSFTGAPEPVSGPALFERLDGRPLTAPSTAGQRPGGPPVLVLSPWGPRAGAALIDFAILLLPRLILIGLLAQTGVIHVEFTGTGTGERAHLDTLAAFEIIGVWLLVNLIYAPIQLSRGGGATLGKRAVRIHVAREDGAPITWSFGAIREVLVKDILFWGVGLYTLLVVPLLDVLWPLWDPKHRALHDMLVKTRVVRTPSA